MTGNLDSMAWYRSAYEYLSRLGSAEYMQQRREAQQQRRKRWRYVPSAYHTTLIACLDTNDEHGFKALKMLQGHASALGV